MRVGVSQAGPLRREAFYMKQFEQTDYPGPVGIPSSPNNGPAAWAPPGVGLHSPRHTQGSGRFLLLLLSLLMLALVAPRCTIAEVFCNDSDPSCSGDLSPLTLLAVAYNLTSLTTPISDTGLLNCYDNTAVLGSCGDAAFPLQDGDFVDTPRPYSMVVNPSGLSVTDEITGLTWQRCPRNAASDCTGTAVPDSQANQISYCNALNLDGLTWRMPSLYELNSMPNFNFASPIVDPSVFPQTTGALNLWSTTEDLTAPTNFYSIQTANGTPTSNPPATTWHIQCVSGPVYSAPQLSIEGRVVRPAGSNLMFHRCEMSGGTILEDGSGGCTGAGATAAWQAALQQCNDLVYAGFDDWRLPNNRELQSLIDYSTVSPATDLGAFPFVASAAYWTSTTNAGNNAQARTATFLSGGSNSGSFKSTTLNVRCVRGP
jgi:hypothetical protein